MPAEDASTGDSKSRPAAGVIDKVYRFSADTESTLGYSFMNVSGKGWNAPIGISPGSTEPAVLG